MILLLLRFWASLTILVCCLLSVYVSPADLISLSDTQTCPSGTNKRVHLVHSHWNHTFFPILIVTLNFEQFLHTTFPCFELDWVVSIRLDDYIFALGTAEQMQAGFIQYFLRNTKSHSFDFESGRSQKELSPFSRKKRFIPHTLLWPPTQLSMAIPSLFIPGSSIPEDLF